MRYKHINLVYVKILVNNQYIERIMMGLDEYLHRLWATLLIFINFGTTDTLNTGL